MPSIRVMDKGLADLIAAGEVVERPASVVKELVENAIDAGATQITVEIRDGGVTYTRVTDNGCGIPREEMATAFLRHATSKLQDPAQLDAIETLGFRGEALAAIAAVARVQMMSKPAGQEMGYSYSIECSEPEEEGDVGCADGTTVVVRDLFFFQPARYKFLKRNVAEGNAVQAVMEQQALGHPNISFRFIREERQVFTTPGDGDPLAVIHTIMPDTAESMIRLPLYETFGKAKLHGYISRPTGCRGSRNSQHFFVNGRWVRSKRITAALEKAYENRRMVGKYPAAVLYLTIDPNLVDVNAHPAKTEVRFLDENDVFSSVYHAVLSELYINDDRPEMSAEPFAPHPTYFELMSPALVADALALKFNPDPSSSDGDDLVEPLENPAAPSADPAAAQYVRKPFKLPDDVEDMDDEDDEGVTMGETAAKAEPSNAAAEPSNLMAEPSNAAEEVIDTPLQAAQGLPAGQNWRMVGEVFNTYIVVEQEDKVVFIDKHAAHERLGFDALKAQCIHPMAQTLLTPLSVKLSVDHCVILLSHAKDLEEFGFQIEDGKCHDILVRACPDFLDCDSIAPTLEELAEQYYMMGFAKPQALRYATLHTMACKAAMKGGQKNQPEELLVIAQAVMSGKVTHCPHGRPVAVQTTKATLEKRFGRA